MRASLALRVAVESGRSGPRPVPTPTPAPIPSPCEDAPLDCVFAIDDTGSMGDVIEQVKAGVADVIAAVEATGGAYRLGLVTFKDEVTVRVPLDALGNAAAVAAEVATLAANAGDNDPEASDTAVLTVVDFDWRPEASKVLILITDAPPGGTDDEDFTEVDRVNAQTAAVLAAAHGIRMAAVFTPTTSDTDYNDTVRGVMQTYATVTEGTFLEVDPTDETNDLAARLVDVIETRACQGEG